MTARRVLRRALLARDVLVVDVGNSKVQAVLVLGGRERLRWRVDYGGRDDGWRRNFAAAAATARQLTGARLGIVMASVAPARARTIDTLLRRFWRPRPHHVDWRDPWPFRLEVRQPWTLGADRLANVAGLRALGLRHGLAIDAGTALTIDVLDDRRYVGGLILPGAALWAQALHAHTAKLPLVRLRADAPLVGRDTESALQAGLYHGLAHAVRGVVAALVARHGRTLRVVLTGGQAGLLARALPHAQLEPDLLVFGLRHLAARRARQDSRPGAG